MKSTVVLVLGILSAGAHLLDAQSTAFTYQGRLLDSGDGANGVYELRLSLHGTASGGVPVAGPVTVAPVSVNNGLLTVSVDFGNGAFNGNPRWLEIAVRTNGSSALPITLFPRQQIAWAPYAIEAAGITGTLPDSQLSGNVARLNGSNLFTGQVVFGNTNDTPFRVTSKKRVPNLNADLLDQMDSTDFVAKTGDTMTGSLNLPPNGLAVGENQMILSDGKVGIGTVSPLLRLEVAEQVGVFLPEIPNRKLSLDYTGGIARLNLNTSGDPLRISKAGIDVVTIDNQNNVGIGTTNPASPLDVTSSGISSSLGGISVHGNSANGFGGLDLYNDVGKEFFISIGGSSAASHWANTASLWSYDANVSLVVGTANAERMRIDAGGNVGVGTTSPQARLDVDDRLKVGALRVERSDINGQAAEKIYTDIDVNDAHLALGARNRNDLVIRRESGNVGIGTTTPVGMLSLGDYQGGTEGSGVVNYAKQLVLGGPYNTGYNRTGVKLHITDYDNDTGNVYPIYVEDENNRVDFYLHTQNGAKTAYFNGNVGIGTFGPTARLQVVNARCDGFSWINASDRGLKENFEVINSREVMEKVVALPITTWRYKTEPGERHIGPVAQDFHAAFGVGADDKHIATVDADGVALAAIQGLHEIVKEQRTELEKKTKQIQTLEERLTVLEKRMVDLADR